MWTKQELNPHQAIGAIITDKEGKILIQFNNKIGKWCIPSGKVDPGKTPEQALKQELGEECGISPKSYRLMGSKTFTYEREGVKVPVVSYVYEVMSYVGKPQNMEPSKHSVQKFMTMDEISKLPGAKSDITQMALKL